MKTQINSKAQASFFVKMMFIVISSIIFIFVFLYMNSFKTSTVEEKESSDFKVATLNILQTLVTNKNCLASQQNESSQKIVLDKNKIEDFALEYSDIEPDCAKALNFDYNIIVVQPEYNFTLYPGEKLVQGELTLSNEFSSHFVWGQSDMIVYFDCNFNPKEHPELCQNTELDHYVCSGCMINPRENCSYDQVKKICCIYYLCPKSACASAETKQGMGDCGSGCTVARDCDLSKCSWYPYHGACGMTYEYTMIPAGELKDVNVEKKVWSFGLSAGMKSFSPDKAKKEELQLSLPITIRYNETFSAEGVIYLYAVRGELEDLYGQLEDICEKVKENENLDINFSREFHFSYPVKYYDNKICMLDSCKNFVCPYDLEFQNTEEGDYVLKFSFNPNSKIITVKK